MLCFLCYMHEQPTKSNSLYWLWFWLLHACLPVSLPTSLSVCSGHLYSSLLLSLWHPVFIQTIPLQIWKMDFFFLPFTGSVTFIQWQQWRIWKKLDIFIHVFKKKERKGIKMIDMRNVINHHISHCLLPNIPSIFLSCCFHLCLRSDNNRLFHVGIFSSDPSGPLSRSLSFTQTN